jgi:hypothetical protein
MGSWGDRKGGGKRRREWEDVRGEEWRSGDGKIGRQEGCRKRRR